jgi:hypothetical protein
MVWSFFAPMFFMSMLGHPQYRVRDVAQTYLASNPSFRPLVLSIPTKGVKDPETAARIEVVAERIGDEIDAEWLAFGMSDEFRRMVEQDPTVVLRVPLAAKPWRMLGTHFEGKGKVLGPLISAAAKKLKWKLWGTTEWSDPWEVCGGCEYFPNTLAYFVYDLRTHGSSDVEW